jgi:hypothetical protein
MRSVSVQGAPAVPSRRLLAAPASLPALGAVLSVSAAIAHFGAMPPHLQEWWAHGAFFAVCGAAQALLALLLLRRPRDWVLLAGIAGNLAIVAMYVYSRTNGSPVGPHEGVPEEPGWYDLTTTAMEVALVGVLIALIGPRAGRWAMRLVLACGAGLWIGRATGFVL